MSSGIFSILIPIAVILLAAFTKRIIPSLIIGVLAGGVALANGNMIQGALAASDHLINSTANAESVYIIFFLFLFGAFAEIMKVAGGIKGFRKLMERWVKTERGALVAIWAVRMLLPCHLRRHDRESIQPGVFENKSMIYVTRVS